MTDFVLTTQQLKDIIEAGLDSKKKEEIEEKVLPKLAACGNIEGILSSLQSSTANGISAHTMESRIACFGENRLPREEPDSLITLMINVLKDPTLIMLMVSAVISIVFGMVFECIQTGWIEGVAIFVAVGVVDVVASVNDYQKDRQFQKLNLIKDDITVQVYRDGIQQLISIYHISVGDVVELAVGDILCADGMYLTGNGLKVNEASLTGEADDLRKGPYNFSPDGDLISSPFLFGGTKVMEGNARMLVLAVGTNSYAGSSAQLIAEEEEEDSILQKQLNKMAQHITTLGTGAAIIVVVVLLIRLAVNFIQKNPGYTSFNTATHPQEILNYFILAITVLVVAIPEGLPLAVTIALAFSVKKMLKDQNLVRHLSACETMGGATTICSDKTGTLTMNRMTVMRTWTFQKERTPANIKSSSWGTESDQTGSNIPAEARKLICSAIALNTSGRLLFPPAGPPEHIGNKTECALLQFVHMMGLNYEEERAANISYTPTIYNFSSARKRMSSAWPSTDGSQLRVFSKGAPEIILDRCSHILDTGTMELLPLVPELRNYLNKVLNSFAEESLRTLCIAYRNVGANEVVQDDADTVETNMICLLVVGIEDPVRPEVPEALKKCRIAGITVRMVTGDNLVTAKSIAQKCGIADQIENFDAMEGPDFRAKVLDPSTGVLNQEAIDKIWPNLLVLARSSPKDKHMLVSGIMASRQGVRQVVAVTGDGTNDAPALRKADVGFAMGITGTSVAKDAADIIIMDDNFSSIVSAVKWGRCVYDNICKFLQFQLTVNIVAITVAVVGACAIEVSPLKAIHLLWINMIMDSLASLALATEGPSDDLLHRLPYGRDRPLLSPIMLRNMLTNAVYQLAVMFWAIWGMYSALGIPSGIPSAATPAPPGSSSSACNNSDITIDFTMVFNIFVFMQLFSEINSRRINNELNVFGGFFANGFFLGVIFITTVCQIILVEFGGVAFETQGLNWSQWLISIVFGVAELPLYPLVFRVIPPSLFEPLSRLLSSAPKDEEPKEEEMVNFSGAEDGSSLGKPQLSAQSAAYRLDDVPNAESLRHTSSVGAMTTSTTTAVQPWQPVSVADELPVISGRLTPTPPDDLDLLKGDTGDEEDSIFPTPAIAPHFERVEQPAASES